MKKIYILLILVISVLTCCTRNDERIEAVIKETDSFVYNTAMQRQINRSLFVIDSLEKKKLLTHQRADYWRGYSYDMCWKPRLANHFYQHAFDAFSDPIKDWQFYIDGGYRLAVMRHNLNDTGGALQLITDLMEKADSNGQLSDNMRAFMLDFIIDCQVELHQYDKAKAYCKETFDLISNDKNASKENKMIKCFGIVESMCKMGDYDEAATWLQLGEEALKDFKVQVAQEGDSIQRSLINEYDGHTSLYKAYILLMKGQKAQAAQIFDAIPDSQLFHPSSIFEASNYLMKAGRYNEALEFYNRFMEKFPEEMGAQMTLEGILSKLAPMYLVNMKAGHNEQALSIGQTICESIDSALACQKKNDVAELYIIYDTQQQEMKLHQAEFRATIYLLSAIALALGVVLVGWSLRRTRKYNKMLAEKNHELYEEVRLCERQEQQAEKQLEKLSQEQLTSEQQLFKRISHLMNEEKPFVNPELNREDLARMLGTNYKYVANAIRECSDGMTISEFIDRHRITHAAQLLATTEDSVSLISMIAGFNNRSHFNKVFRNRYKMTPREYRSVVKE